MKTLKTICCLLGIAAIMLPSSCKKDGSYEEESSISCTFTVSMAGNKTKVIQDDGEDNVNNYIILLSDVSTGEVRYKKTSPDGTPINISILKGAYDVDVFVNAATVLEAETSDSIANYRAKAFEYSDESVSSQIAYYHEQGRFFDKGSDNIEVLAVRIFAKVEIDKIKVDFSACPLLETYEWKLKEIFIINAVTKCDVIDSGKYYNDAANYTARACKPSSTEEFYKFGYQDCGGINLIDSAYTVPTFFYVFPNKVETDSREKDWCPRHTRLDIVIDCSNGVEYHYPIDLSGLNSGDLHKISSVTIKNYGTPGPDEKFNSDVWPIDVQSNVIPVGTEAAGDASIFDFEEGSIIYLSADGTANCYIVNEPGQFYFSATTKGSGSENLDGIPISAEVLWESFGTKETPNIGDVIDTVSFSDGYVYFSTPSALNNGNAVIAVKDTAGNILWSWHIWVCEDFDAHSTAHVYNNNAGTMMDRNLGATSATPGTAGTYGLVYQWGRKDPFLGGGIYMNSTNSSNWHNNSKENTGTIAYATGHPMTFISYSAGSNGDWHYTGSDSPDNTRWQTSDKDKGVYDPCPTGWRVPDGDVWSKAFGSTYETNGPWDDTNRGMDFGSGNGHAENHQLGSAITIWYPATGSYYSAWTYVYLNYGAKYWSCTPGGKNASSLTFMDSGGGLKGIFYSGTDERYNGCAVRCISESE